LLFILIDHNMVLGYNYSKQKRRWWQTNAPHPLAVLMATAVRQSDTDGIAQCGISTATGMVHAWVGQKETPLTSS
jgi:hypothetical protein